MTIDKILKGFSVAMFEPWAIDEVCYELEAAAPPDHATIECRPGESMSIWPISWPKAPREEHNFGRAAQFNQDPPREEAPHTFADDGCWCGNRHFVPRPPKSRPYDYTLRSGRKRR